MYNLDRFVRAQESSYGQALSEIKRGQKTGHWMWFIFPQLKGLGRSQQSGYFGLMNLAEAIAYVSHDVLGQRLHEISHALLTLPHNDPVQVFGGIDAQKLRSSMTLFSKTQPMAADTTVHNIFEEILHRFFTGQTCSYTMQHLAQISVPDIAKARRSVDIPLN